MVSDYRGRCEFHLKKFRTAVFPGLLSGSVGPTKQHPSLIFTSNGSLSSLATPSLGFRSPAQSYPIRNPTRLSSLSGISFAIPRRRSHDFTALRLWILFFSKVTDSRVYGGRSSISTCKKYALTFTPETRREFTIEIL